MSSKSEISAKMQPIKPIGNWLILTNQAEIVLCAQTPFPTGSRNFFNVRIGVNGANSILDVGFGSVAHQSLMQLFEAIGDNVKCLELINCFLGLQDLGVLLAKLKGLESLDLNNCCEINFNTEFRLVATRPIELFHMKELTMKFCNEKLQYIGLVFLTNTIRKLTLVTYSTTFLPLFLLRQSKINDLSVCDFSKTYDRKTTLTDVTAVKLRSISICINGYEGDEISIIKLLLQQKNYVQHLEIGSRINNKILCVIGEATGLVTLSIILNSVDPTTFAENIHCLKRLRSLKIVKNAGLRFDPHLRALVEKKNVNIRKLEISFASRLKANIFIMMPFSFPNIQELRLCCNLSIEIIINVFKIKSLVSLFLMDSKPLLDMKIIQDMEIIEENHNLSHLSLEFDTNSSEVIEAILQMAPNCEKLKFRTSLKSTALECLLVSILMLCKYLEDIDVINEQLLEINQNSEVLLITLEIASNLDRVVVNGAITSEGRNLLNSMTTIQMDEVEDVVTIIKQLRELDHPHMPETKRIKIENQ